MKEGYEANLFILCLWASTRRGHMRQICSFCAPMKQICLFCAFATPPKEAPPPERIPIKKLKNMLNTLKNLTKNAKTNTLNIFYFLFIFYIIFFFIENTFCLRNVFFVLKNARNKFFLGGVLNHFLIF